LLVDSITAGINDDLIYLCTPHTAGVFVPVTVGVLWRSATRVGALSSLIGGSIVALWGILTKANILGAAAEIYAAVISLIIFVLVSLATRKQLDGVAS